MFQRTLVGVLLLSAMAAAQDDARVGYDRWSAWNGFGEGSSVTVETLSGSTKNVKKFYLVKKGPERIDLTLSSEWGGQKSDSHIIVAASEIAQKKESAEVLCQVCGKHKVSEVKDGKETLMLGGKELACTWTEVTRLDCNAKKSTVIQTWYSKELPGWVAKEELMTPTSGRPSTTVSLCTSFEKK